MRRNGLSRLERTYFARCLVADSDDEVQLRCAEGGELIPAFAAQCFNRVSKCAHLLDSEGIHAAGGMAARAVGAEAARAELPAQRMRML